jgi:peptidoglycan/xylan/chitin deacetylase (PgdA/CDA1 family)
MWFDRAVLTVQASGDKDLRAAAQAFGIAPPAASELSQGRVPAWVEALKRNPFQRRLDFLRRLSPPSNDPSGSAIFRAMTPEQVAGLARRGHEIGSHSVSHEILTLASEESLATELTASRETIAGWIGGPVNGFCYPNGSHDELVATATRRAGYAYACTTLPPARNQPEDPWRMGRHDVTPDRVSRDGTRLDLTAFRAEISGLHEAWR